MSVDLMISCRMSCGRRSARRPICSRSWSRRSRRAVVRDAGRLAHTIKAAGRTFGVDQLLRHAQRIEELAPAGDLDAARQATADLRVSVDRFLCELQARLRQEPE